MRNCTGCRFTSLALLCLTLLSGLACAKAERMAQAPAPPEEIQRERSKPSDSGEALAAETPRTAASRILVKTGSLTLVVDDASQAQDSLQALLRGYDAYLAGRQSHAFVPDASYLAPSEVHQMTLTIKVPAERFDAFVEEVKSLGSYTSEQIGVEDVTFEYVDLEARLANQKKVEERLLGHLQTSARELKDIIEVERELARVRESIESLTARFAVLEDRVAFSTLTLTLSVQPDFRPAVERTFLQQLQDKFLDSLAALGDTAKVSVIVFLSSLPWLFVFGAIFYLLLRLRRWRRNRRQQK